MTPEQELEMIERDLYGRYKKGLLAKEDIEAMGISFDKLLKKYEEVDVEKT